jgi:hypothetical protein
MTPAQLSTALEDLTLAADVALPLAGHAELVPIANAALALIQKIAVAAQNASGDATVTAAMSAARLAADVAEQLKFGGKP